MSGSGGFTVPAGGFAFLAASQDACDGDVCIIPGAVVAPADASGPSFRGGDVGDGRLES